MTQLGFIILLYWYFWGQIMVQSQFEVIEDKDDDRISMDYDTLKKHDELHINKNKFSKSRHNKFPYNFRSAYPPSATYLLWLKNNKTFPRWVYDMVRSKYHDENLEWRVNELSKLYKKCDMITGGFPLSGIYIRHLIELINLQRRVDDHSIIQDINSKQDLDYLRTVHLPTANNLTIRLQLKDEDEILKKVDPIGYLKALALKSTPVRNILYRKYLNILQDKSSIGENEILKNINNQRNRSSNRLQRRIKSTRTRLRHKKIKPGSGSWPIVNVSNYNPMNKIQNIIDLIEDPGLNISRGLRKELREVCKDYLNNYLQETYNLTNILKQYLEEKQLDDDSNYSNLSWDSEQTTIERIRNNKSRETDSFFSFDNDYKNDKKRKHGKAMPNDVIFDKNGKEIEKNANTTAGDAMYNKLKLKSSIENEKKRRLKFSKFTDYIENTKIYRKIRKEFSDNYLLSKYDLIDVLENIGFNLPKESKEDLTYLYGELLKHRQRKRLKEVFNEQNYDLCFPDMKYESVIDMLTSLMLCNINNRRHRHRPQLANVLENLGFEMTRSAKKKINKLYLTKIKSNSNNDKPVFT